MTLKEINPLIRRGKVGIIPSWKGYIKWNYALDKIQFTNNDYIMTQEELEDKIRNRNDLYYII